MDINCSGKQEVYHNCLRDLLSCLMCTSGVDLVSNEKKNFFIFNSFAKAHHSHHHHCSLHGCIDWRSKVSLKQARQVTALKDKSQKHLEQTDVKFIRREIALKKKER